MFGLILNWNFIALFCFFLIASRAKRPEFRHDYMYEKAYDTFYKVHHGALPWAEARIRCQVEGTELLLPESLDEADAIPLMVTLILNRFEGIFVGIHDLYSERSFVTLHGNSMQSSILNLLWEYKEPMYGGGRCVAMRRTGRLFVHPCDNSLPFICKVRANKLKYNKECDSFNPHWKKGPNNTGACYFMHTEPQTWHQAFATCLAGGGHLAIIDDKSEADFFKETFKKTEHRRIPDNNIAYLGFSDLFIKHHYRTIHGQPLDELAFKDWEVAKCRNDNMTDQARDFRCGGISRSGRLTTWRCEIPAMFFCEKPAKNKTRPEALPELTAEPIQQH